MHLRLWLFFFFIQSRLWKCDFIELVYKYQRILPRDDSCWAQCCTRAPLPQATATSSKTQNPQQRSNLHKVNYSVIHPWREKLRPSTTSTAQSNKHNIILNSIPHLEAGAQLVACGRWPWVSPASCRQAPSVRQAPSGWIAPIERGWWPPQRSRWNDHAAEEARTESTTRL